MNRILTLGVAALAIGLFTAGDVSAQCGGRVVFSGGHCGGGRVFSGGHVFGGHHFAPSYSCGTPVGYVTPVRTCGTVYGTCSPGVQYGTPVQSYQFGPAPLPSSTIGGTPTPYIVPQPTPEVVPPTPKKGPAPLPSKETSSNTGPTYYLINGVYYLAAK